jgi:hypothetical protein
MNLKNRQEENMSLEKLKQRKNKPVLDTSLLNAAWKLI